MGKRIVLFFFIILFLVDRTCSMEFNFTETLKPKVKIYTPDPNLHIETCATNEPANIKWQKCTDGHEGEDCFNENMKCKDILKNDTLLLITYPSDEIAKLKIRHQPTYPESGCFKCIAKSKKSSKIINQTLSFAFIDYCGTPSMNEARENPEFQCFSRSRWGMPIDVDYFNRYCKVSAVKDIKVYQSIDSRVNSVYFMATWKHDEYRSASNVGVFGFNISLEENDQVVCEICFFTVHRKIKNNTYQYKLPGNSCRTNIEWPYETTIRVQALPTSDVVALKFEIEPAHVLCEKYIQRTGKIPFRCHMVYNISKSECSPNKSVTISWNERNLTNVEENVHLWILFSEFSVKIPKGQMSYTLHNVVTYITVIVTVKQLYPKDDITPHDAEIQVYPCPDATTTILPITTTKKTPAKRQIWVLVVIIISILVIAVAIFVLFIFCGLKKIGRMVARPYIRVLSRDSGANLVEEEKDETVMLVYPHGCERVENIVLYLAAQLNSFGIKVLVDNLQTNRVDSIGLPSVLMKDFKTSDYIVAICTEPETTELASHRPFQFMIHNLISSECVYENKNRCVAVFFTKTPDTVPSFLRQNCYSLPSSFGRFVQHLLGIQTFFSVLYEKLFSLRVEEATKIKAELRLLTQALNMAEHGTCNSATCKKGAKVENVEIDYPTAETLQQEADKELRANDSRRDSLIFSSMESLNENENTLLPTKNGTVPTAHAPLAEYEPSTKPVTYFKNAPIRSSQKHPLLDKIEEESCSETTIPSHGVLFSQLSKTDELEHANT